MSVFRGAYETILCIVRTRCGWPGYANSMSLGRLLLILFAAVLPAQAVIVRGKVTSPLGVPIPGARVQLILGPRSVASTIAGPDGSYEIRTDLSGRFVLLTSASVAARQPAVQVSAAFYGGRTDDLHLDIALDPSSLTPETSAVATGQPVPLAQLASRPTQVAADQLLTRRGIVEELRQQALSAVVVQLGQTGTPAALYLRGADPAELKLVLDGVSAERLGGGFDLSQYGASGLAAVSPEPAMELIATPLPLQPGGAEAGALTLHDARAALASGFSLTYAGDAGPLATVNNQAEASYAHTRFDLRGSFSRFDTANATPVSQFHQASSAADIGYHISGNTTLRATLRDDVSASALPSPYEFFGVQPSGRVGAQNLNGGGSLNFQTGQRWQHSIQFGLLRDREQTFDFTTPATGRPVMISGANGDAASGVATFNPLPSREDRVTDRNEYSYRTIYTQAPWLSAHMLIRYQQERGADLLPAALAATHPSIRLERTHLSFAGGLAGDLGHRVFYEASGLLDFGSNAAAAQPNTLGLRGSPRVGLTWTPKRPGKRRLSGTILHATAATGLREPTLDEQIAFPSARTVPRSRTFDTGIEQNLIHEKLVVRATYFHSQFAHQTELLAPETTAARALLSDTLGYRAQGIESSIRYTPRPRLYLNGGYTYLATLVEQSAVQPVINPAFAQTPIGATSALFGARPFHRPPHTGFVSAEFSGKRLNASIAAAFASRSDDSTALTLNPNLLLPNRNLSPGYAAIDANLIGQLTKRVAVYTQLENLADSRRLAPIGYLSTPFLIRTGLRIRLGRE